MDNPFTNLAILAGKICWNRHERKKGDPTPYSGIDAETITIMVWDVPGMNLNSPLRWVVSGETEMVTKLEEIKESIGDCKVTICSELQVTFVCERDMHENFDDEWEAE